MLSMLEPRANKETTYNDPNVVSDLFLVSIYNIELGHKLVDERQDTLCSDRLRELDEENDEELELGQWCPLPCRHRF